MSTAEVRTAAEVQAARQELLSSARNTTSLIARQRRVRATIERSWRRSIMTAEPTAPARFVSESDVAEPLLRAALPVLEHWLPSLEDSSAALFLSDRTGRIVARRVGDRSHARRLDKASAAEGFDFSEPALGTNGLGTAIEERTAVLVRGAEHFNDALQSLACAGAPILDLSTGRVLGSLSIAAPASRASQIMLTVARQAACQIEHAYIDNTLPSHLRAVLALLLRNAAQRPTLVISRDGVFSSLGGLPLVSPENHVLIWERLQACDWSLGDQSITIVGRDGVARRVGDPRGAHAFIVEFDVAERSAPVSDDSMGGVRATVEDPRRSPLDDHASSPDATPLRDDPERIAAVIRRLRESSGTKLSAAGMQALLRWDWPGGIAELEEVLGRLARDFPNRTVPLSALPEAMRLRGTPTSGIAAAERRAIETVLRVTGGNRTEAAGLLGIGRTTLWRKMRSYGMDERQYLAD